MCPRSPNFVHSSTGLEKINDGLARRAIGHIRQCVSNTSGDEMRVSPEPSHVLGVVEHKPYSCFLPLGLEWLPGQDHSLHDDSVGVNGQYTMKV